MEKGNLFVEVENSIATLYINRPEKRNAFNYDMWRKFPQLLKEMENDDNVKVLIIRGIDETAFAAGADISEFTTLRSTAVGEQLYNEAVTAAELALLNFPKPTIAMVQKYCIGGGMILALACDLRFSSESGLFAITPSKIGLIYSFNGTKNLVDLIGPARTKDLLFSARQLGVYEAYGFGLIERIFPENEIEEKTYEYAELLTNLAQKTIKGAKKIVKEINSGATRESEEIRELTVSSYASKDYQEGIKAFLDKRKPQFNEI